MTNLLLALLVAAPPAPPAAALTDPPVAEKWQQLEGHEARVRCVAFSRDSKLLASGDEKGTVIVWDVATGKQMFTIKGKPPVVYWDMATGKQFFAEGGGPSNVYALVFLADDKTLLMAGLHPQPSGGSGCRLTWYDLAGRRLRHLDLPGSIYPLKLSPDGKTLATGDTWPLGAADLKLRDPATGEERASLACNKRPSGIAAFAPDSKRIAMVDRDGLLLAWDVTTRRELFRRATGRPAGSLTFSPDGRTLALSGDRSIRLLDAADGTEKAGSQDENSASDSLVYVQGGKALLAVQVGSLVVLDPIIGRYRKRLSGHHADIQHLVASPDGKLLATAGGRDQLVIVWRVADGK